MIAATTVAEYALRGTSKPIADSEYTLTRALPVNLQSALPTVEQIEAVQATVSAKSVSGTRGTVVLHRPATLSF